MRCPLFAGVLGVWSGCGLWVQALCTFEVLSLTAVGLDLLRCQPSWPTASYCINHLQCSTRCGADVVKSWLVALQYAGHRGCNLAHLSGAWSQQCIHLFSFASSPCVRSEAGEQATCCCSQQGVSEGG